MRFALSALALMACVPAAQASVTMTYEGDGAVIWYMPGSEPTPIFVKMLSTLTWDGRGSGLYSYSAIYNYTLTRISDGSLLTSGGSEAMDPRAPFHIDYPFPGWDLNEREIGTYMGGGRITRVNGAVVPEPATWLTMMAGLALLGVALRRRDQVAVAGLL